MAARRKMTRTSYVAPPNSIIEKNTHDAAQKIMELQKQLAADDMGRTNTIQHAIDLFMGTHDLGIPEDKRYVAFDAKTNKPADIIFRIKGMLSGKMKFRYVIPSTKADDVKRADSIEGHINEYYPTMRRRTQEDVAGQALFWQLLGGTSYIQQTVDMYYWDKNEQKRKAHEKIDPENDDSAAQKKKDDDYNERVDEYRQWAGPPMVLESLDPRMVWPVRTKARGTIAYVKFYKVTRYDFAESFRARGKTVHWDDDGKVAKVDKGVAGMEYAESADVSLSNSCEYYEYIDDHCVYYVADGHVVDKYEHRGGIKIFPAYCLQTGLNESATNSVGVLWPVRNEIMQLDFYRTLWANKAYLEIFPQLFAILDGNSDPLTGEDGKPIQWDLEPGTVKQLRGRLENPMANAASGTDFRALIEMESNEIDAATISGVARGIAGMQQPGYSIQQLSQGMRTMWRDCIDSRELQWAGVIEHYLWCIRHIIKDPSSVYAEASNETDGRKFGTYVTVKPDDIDDHYRVVATLSPDLPIDRQGLINIWWMLFEKGGATWDEFAREGKGIDSPQANLRQIRKEAMQKEGMGKIMEDAIALGHIRAQAKILEEGKFLELNPTFSVQNQLLKEARNPQPAADEGMGMAPPMAPPAPGGGTGIPPTAGMNPADSAPGPRQGDMSSGSGLR